MIHHPLSPAHPMIVSLKGKSNSNLPKKRKEMMSFIKQYWKDFKVAGSYLPRLKMIWGVLFDTKTFVIR